MSEEQTAHQRRERFSRERRLLKAAEFSACLAQGQRLGGAYVRVHALHRDGSPRLGFAISRKVDARAVVRNRIKRCLRECFRRHACELPGVDLVISGKREAAAASNRQLRDEFTRLLARLRRLKPDCCLVTMPTAPASSTPER